MLKRLLEDPGLPASQPTESYWQIPPRKDFINVQSRGLPEHRDIIIIGSGITGCSVAWWLLKGGTKHSVTVLDAREICSGATGRNGGRINCVAVQDYDKYSRKFGHDAAVKIVRFSLAHFDSILSAAKELGAEAFDYAECREVETVAAVFTEEKLAELKIMLENFESAFPDLRGRWRVCDQEECAEKFNLGQAKGALIGVAGAAWPYRLITSMFALMIRTHGEQLSLEANTPALSIKKNASAEYPYTITTSRGDICAKHVVHCTEGHAAHLLPRLRGILVPRRGQMTVQNPGDKMPDLHGKRSWSFYFAQTFDYLTQNHRTGEIFIGGGDIGGVEGASDVLGIPSDSEESLIAKSHLGGVLPVAFGVENWGKETSSGARVKAGWSGIMCNSLDGAPLVGMLPEEALDRENGDDTGAEWIAAGYGGYGMVNSWLCGKAIAEMIQGRDVSSWLPDNYVITTDRMKKLSSDVARLANSPLHIKALL